MHQIFYTLLSSWLKHYQLNHLRFSLELMALVGSSSLTQGGRFMQNLLLHSDVLETPSPPFSYLKPHPRLHCLALLLAW